MGAKLKVSAGGGIHFKPGTYLATVLTTAEDVLENSQYGTGEIIRFELEPEGVFDESGDAIQIDAIASRKLSPKSKLYSWLQACGVDLTTGREVDMDEAVGARVQIKVIDKPSKDGTATFSSVDDIFPTPENQPTQKPVEEMEIGDYWAHVRAQGVEIAAIKNLAAKQFGKEPHQLTGEERKSLFLAALEG